MDKAIATLNTMIDEVKNRGRQGKTPSTGPNGAPYDGSVLGRVVRLTILLEVKAELEGKDPKTAVPDMAEVAAMLQEA